MILVGSSGGRKFCDIDFDEDDDEDDEDFEIEDNTYESKNVDEGEIPKEKLKVNFKNV